MGVDPIRPARFWYWVAGAAAAVAVVWLVLGLVLGLLWVTRQVEAFQRVPIPGAVQVSFDEPGGYTIYYEWEGLGAAEHVPLPSFNATLTSVSTGEQVSIRDYGARRPTSLRAARAWRLEPSGSRSPAGSCSRPRGSPMADRPTPPLAQVSAGSSSAG
jgi:hypothetical protein